MKEMLSRGRVQRVVRRDLYSTGLFHYCNSHRLANSIFFLFLAFHASIAISPTDAPVLSRWAKILMMIQTMISLLVIAFLAGRAFDLL